SPFVDRRHGTERAIAELIDRLAGTYGNEVHLFSQRVEGIALSPRQAPRSAGGSVVWHRVAALPGPHLLQFLAWLLCNRVLRRQGEFDLVLSAGINCFDADLILVHAVFRRVAEVSRLADRAGQGRGGLLRQAHRRAYYGLLQMLEHKVYADN